MDYDGQYCGIVELSTSLSRAGGSTIERQSAPTKQTEEACSKKLRDVLLFDKSNRLDDYHSYISIQVRAQDADPAIDNVVYAGLAIYSIKSID
jgi:hypothetical protein